MTIYKLDENRDVFISGNFNQGSYMFRRRRWSNTSNGKLISDIDLRKDKLIIYGTEITKSMWDKLHNTLVFQSNSGKLYVNCNGACYFYATKGNSYQRPISNVLFNWSSFGVTVPNSAHHRLRVELQHKDQNLAAIKGEASAYKEGWEASKREVTELKKQIYAYRSEIREVVTALQINNDISSDLKDELKSTKDQLESSHQKITQLETQRSTFDSVEDRFNSIMDELNDIKENI